MNDDRLLKRIGLDIKYYRLRNNIDQRDLAKQAGVALTSLKKLENGKGANLKSFIKVLKATDLLPLLGIGKEEVPKRQRASKNKSKDGDIKKFRGMLWKEQQEREFVKMDFEGLMEAIFDTEKERGITIIDERFKEHWQRRVEDKMRYPGDGNLAPEDLARFEGPTPCPSWMEEIDGEEFY